jgi:hypothetical protein
MLYLQLWPFSLPFYPALGIPWSDVVGAQTEHVVLHHYVRPHSRARPAVTLQLSERAVREIAAEAGDAWPDVRSSSAASTVGSREKGKAAIDHTEAEILG